MSSLVNSGPSAAGLSAGLLPPPGPLDPGLCFGAAEAGFPPGPFDPGLRLGAIDSPPVAARLTPERGDTDASAPRGSTGGGGAGVSRTVLDPEAAEVLPAALAPAASRRASSDFNSVPSLLRFKLTMQSGGIRYVLTYFI